MKTILSVGIIFLFVGTSIIPVIAQGTKNSQSLRGNWWYVGGTGPGNYSRIQDAINNSSTGDTVFVYDGVYYENVVINITINLIGGNRNTTIIDGKKNSHVIVLGADNIKISEFTIRNCSTFPHEYTPELLIFSSNNIISHNVILTDEEALNYGITIAGNHNNIIGNIFINNWIGVKFDEGASYNYIAENIFKSHHGVVGEASCRFNNIFHNNISGWINIVANASDWEISYNRLSGAGIFIHYCTNMTITGNEIINSNQAMSLFDDHYFSISNNSIHGHLDISSCSYLTIINNTIDTASVGIYYNEVKYGNISFNKIDGCDYGLQITSPGKSNFIFNNEFRNNEEGLYTLVEFGAVKITCNNFINNSRDISFGQLFPIRRQTPRHPIFDKNYYDDWSGVGPKVLLGRSLIFAIFFWYFFIPICIPGVYCDWHPAQEPYDLLEVSC
ncbi:MAG: right-handed parallel beta-helix repeat-containing protein [Candidatus Thermoplasmatota archaeon]|nr:right-handed parallel beta-helix repeat-containing protein [Candidatus Thermoplasmatota archaeon]